MRKPFQAANVANYGVGDDLVRDSDADNCVYSARFDLLECHHIARLECSIHGEAMSGGSVYREEGVESGRIRIHPELEPWAPLSLIQVIALSDCANLFSAVGNLQPRATDRLTSLSLCFTRGLAQQIHFSFLEAIYNLAGSITKLLGSRKLFCRLCHSRTFALSFVGRQKIKQQRAAARDEVEEKASSTSSVEKR